MECNKMWQRQSIYQKIKLGMRKTNKRKWHPKYPRKPEKESFRPSKRPETFSKTLINKITIPSKLVIYAKIKFVGELRLNTVATEGRIRPLLFREMKSFIITHEIHIKRQRALWITTEGKRWEGGKFGHSFKPSIPTYTFQMYVYKLYI